MLPLSRSYLLKADYTEHRATVLQLCLFYFGIAALRLFSMLMETFLPSLQHTHHNDSNQSINSFNGVDSQFAEATFHDADIENGALRDPRPSVVAPQVDRSTIIPPILIDVGPDTDPSSSKQNICPRAPGKGNKMTSDPNGCNLSRSYILRAEQDPSISHVDLRLPEHERGAKITVPDERHHTKPNIDHDLDPWRSSSQRDFQSDEETSFLSIGLQSAAAIALHKIPEGFIIFSTNRIDPKLGFATFVSLLVHNLMEGFTVSLSLYMALRSRGGAIAWASIIGCGSQPVGAAIALLWFSIVKGPRLDIYGGFFAVTAGIMISLAFSLFSEALILTHRSSWCCTFVFLGMAIVSLTYTWTA